MDLGEVQVPAEGQANHIDVFLAVPEGAGQRDVHWKGDKRRMGLSHWHGASTWLSGCGAATDIHPLASRTTAPTCFCRSSTFPGACVNYSKAYVRGHRGTFHELPILPSGSPVSSTLSPPPLDPPAQGPQEVRGRWASGDRMSAWS